MNWECLNMVGQRRRFSILWISLLMEVIVEVFDHYFVVPMLINSWLFIYFYFSVRAIVFGLHKLIFVLHPKVSMLNFLLLVILTLLVLFILTLALLMLLGNMVIIIHFTSLFIIHSIFLIVVIFIWEGVVCWARLGGVVWRDDTFNWFVVFISTILYFSLQFCRFSVFRIYKLILAKFTFIILLKAPTYTLSLLLMWKLELKCVIFHQRDAMMMWVIIHKISTSREKKRLKWDNPSLPECNLVVSCS